MKRTARSECARSFDQQGLGLSVASGEMVPVDEFPFESVHGNISVECSRHHGGGGNGKGRSTPTNADAFTCRRRAVDVYVSV